MKIAVTTSGNGLECRLDSRFGRAPRFLVYDTEDDSFEIVDNKQHLDAAQGAGIQSARLIASLGVEAVLTGHCGPKAFQVLSAAGIEVFNVDGDNVTVADAFADFRDRKLVRARSADVEGHWT